MLASRLVSPAAAPVQTATLRRRPASLGRSRCWDRPRVLCPAVAPSSPKGSSKGAEEGWWVSVVDAEGEVKRVSRTLDVNGVTVSMSSDEGSSRTVWAAVNVSVPIEKLWEVLTDYDHLGDFVPSLAENRVVERRPGAVRLYQVGEQDVMMGAKFKAQVTLDCQEVPEGMLQRWTKEDLKAAGMLSPPGADAAVISRSICFSLIEGDFRAFDGTWHMQERAEGGSRLIYVVRIQPQIWLPVMLIEGRILKDVGVNIAAVRAFASTGITCKKH